MELIDKKEIFGRAPGTTNLLAPFEQLISNILKDSKSNYCQYRVLYENKMYDSKGFIDVSCNHGYFAIDAIQKVFTIVPYNGPFRINSIWESTFNNQIII